MLSTMTLDSWKVYNNSVVLVVRGHIKTHKLTPKIRTAVASKRTKTNQGRTDGWFAAGQLVGRLDGTNVCLSAIAVSHRFAKSA